MHTAISHAALYPGWLKEPNVHKMEKTQVGRLDLFSCTYFALWLPQCHIKYLRFRYINIMLQALEQDREYIKQGTNDNTYRLLVDESVSPHSE